jgi:hypothetical protein
MSKVIKETKEYWENCLAEYREALQAEFEMELTTINGLNDLMIQLLKFEIEECIKQLT